MRPHQLASMALAFLLAVDINSEPSSLVDRHDVVRPVFAQRNLAGLVGSNREVYVVVVRPDDQRAALGDDDVLLGEGLDLLEPPGEGEAVVRLRRREAARLVAMCAAVDGKTPREHALIDEDRGLLGAAARGLTCVTEPELLHASLPCGRSLDGTPAVLLCGQALLHGLPLNLERLDTGDLFLLEDGVLAGVLVHTSLLGLVVSVLVLVLVKALLLLPVLLLLLSLLALFSLVLSLLLLVHFFFTAHFLVHFILSGQHVLPVSVLLLVGAAFEKSVFALGSCQLGSGTRARVLEVRARCVLDPVGAGLAPHAVAVVVIVAVEVLAHTLERAARRPAPRGDDVHVNVRIVAPRVDADHNLGILVADNGDTAPVHRVAKMPDAVPTTIAVRVEPTPVNEQRVGPPPRVNDHDMAPTTHGDGAVATRTRVGAAKLQVLHLEILCVLGEHKLASDLVVVRVAVEGTEMGVSHCVTCASAAHTRAGALVTTAHTAHVGDAALLKPVEGTTKTAGLSRSSGAVATMELPVAVVASHEGVVSTLGRLDFGQRMLLASSVGPSSVVPPGTLLLQGRDLALEGSNVAVGSVKGGLVLLRDGVEPFGLVADPSLALERSGTAGGLLVGFGTGGLDVVDGVTDLRLEVRDLGSKLCGLAGLRTDLGCSLRAMGTELGGELSVSLAQAGVLGGGGGGV
mmetsp:Transcript_36557/g.84743  ORF Transcript_36557/g.84743 Transcript_36557/m.84743 type:complete len:686 (+) Transcript_36557:191-2248(+)